MHLHGTPPPPPPPFQLWSGLGKLNTENDPLKEWLLTLQGMVGTVHFCVCLIFPKWCAVNTHEALNYVRNLDWSTGHK